MWCESCDSPVVCGSGGPGDVFACSPDCPAPSYTLPTP